MTWEVGKTYKTRTGHEAICIHIVGKDRPVFLFTWPKGYENSRVHAKDGSRGDGLEYNDDVMLPETEFVVGKWYKTRNGKLTMKLVAIEDNSLVFYQPASSIVPYDSSGIRRRDGTSRSHFDYDVLLPSVPEPTT